MTMCGSGTFAKYRCQNRNLEARRTCRQRSDRYIVVRTDRGMNSKNAAHLWRTGQKPDYIGQQEGLVRPYVNKAARICRKVRYC
jgi:hypothetical protein